MRDARAVLTALTLLGLAGTAVGGCGHAAAAAKAPGISLSVPSGPPGTIVTISGEAGADCTLNKNWFGFTFGPAGGDRSEPVTQMDTSVATDGSWQASFTIPVFLGARAKGAARTVRPGAYRFYAPNCRGRGSENATFQVTAAGVAGSTYVAMAVTSEDNGYWLLQADGRVHAFGQAKIWGALPPSAARQGDAVALARTYDNRGYWVAFADGRVYDVGDARDFGSLHNTGADGPVTSMASNPKGDGYWLLSADGRVHGFGTARALGALPARFAPYDAIATRPGGGYVVTSANNGAVYEYPGGQLASGGPGEALASTLVGTAVTPSGNGTWQAGSDGSVITGGDATYQGAIPGGEVTPRATITAIAATPDGGGYWLLGNNGSLFAFGDAPAYTNPH